MDVVVDLAPLLEAPVPGGANAKALPAFEIVLQVLGEGGACTFRDVQED